MKTCKKCEVSKERSEFYKHSTTADGLQGYCKQCSLAIIKDRRVAKGRKVRMTNNNFSTTRHCDLCDTDVDWKSYYYEQGMCSTCWRKRLASKALDGPEQHHSSKKKKNTVQDALAFVEAQIAKSANRTNSDA